MTLSAKANAVDPAFPFRLGPPQEDEQKLGNQMAVAFLLASTQTKDAVDWALVTTGVYQKGWDPKAFYNEVTDQFVNNFQKRVLKLLIRSAKIGEKDMITQWGGTWTNSQIAELIDPWAARYAQAMADQVGMQSQEAARITLTRLLNEGMHPVAIANRLKDSYGMDPRSATSLLNLAATMLKKPNQSLIAPDRLLKAASILLNRRAQLVGEVNSFTALNFGRELMMMKQIYDGKLDPNAKKVWVTALDERVCKVCRPMDQVTAKIGEPFKVGEQKLLVPPVHPRCRCTIVPEQIFQGGIITRRARYHRDLTNRSKLVALTRDLLHFAAVDEDTPQAS